METTDWQNKMKKIIPSFGQSLAVDAALCKQVRERTSKNWSWKFKIFY